MKGLLKALAGMFRASAGSSEPVVSKKAATNARLCLESLDQRDVPAIGLCQVISMGGDQVGVASPDHISVGVEIAKNVNGFGEIDVTINLRDGTYGIVGVPKDVKEGDPFQYAVELYGPEWQPLAKFLASEYLLRHGGGINGSMLLPDAPSNHIAGVNYGSGVNEPPGMYGNGRGPTG